MAAQCHSAWLIANSHHFMVYQLFADTVLVVHVALVAFVVAGLVLVVAGNLRGWNWVNAWWFRLAHLAIIAFVVAEVWLDVTCPLTSLEMFLRARAGSSSYSGGFVEHWMQRLLYYDAPAWVFAAVYSLFGLLVVAAWLRYPPSSRNRNNDPGFQPEALP
jgi:Protein of Unknown function (DUF2784)